MPSDSGSRGLRVTVPGHTLALIDDMMVVAVFGLVFMLSAAAAFSRRE